MIFEKNMCILQINFKNALPVFKDRKVLEFKNPKLNSDFFNKRNTTHQGQN